MPNIKITVIVNKEASKARSFAIENLKRLLNQLEFTGEVYFTKPKKLENLIKEVIKKNPDVLLIGGGDGTVRTAAQIISGSSISLAIWPIGTFNHFAKTLDLPSDFEELLNLIKNNKTVHIDLGSVNNFVFVNNSSIGLYSKLVREREKYTQIFVKRKIWKIILNITNFFSFLPNYHLNLKINNLIKDYKTYLIFIGNNFYKINLTNFGQRESLREGKLSIYILKCKSKWEMIKLIFHIIFKNQNLNEYLELFMIEEATIFSRSKRVNVVLDGELYKITAPLKYSIKPGFLSVIVK